MLRFPKVLEVMGESKAGKKTIIGCLMYKCCFDLAQLGCWERDGLHHYEEISLFYERNGGSCCFFAPNGPMTVKTKQASNAGSNASAPDYVLWVVDVTSADKGKASYDLLMSGLSDCSIRYTTCLIIVINKMDKINWSETAFGEMTKLFSQAIPDADRVRIIPLSATRGENVLLSPETPPWFLGGGGWSLSSAISSMDKPLIRLFE